MRAVAGTEHVNTVTLGAGAGGGYGGGDALRPDLAFRRTDQVVGPARGDRRPGLGLPGCDRRGGDRAGQRPQCRNWPTLSAVMVITPVSTTSGSGLIPAARQSGTTLIPSVFCQCIMCTARKASM